MMRQKQKQRLILISILTLVVIAAGIMAITDPEVNNYHVGAGGLSLGGGYTLNGAIGQHDASGALTGGGFTLYGGLFAGGGAAENSVYLPLVSR